MSVFTIIHEGAKVAGLEFLIIGGHAVNSHGYLRTTLDVDLLVSEVQLSAWKDLLSGLGYTWGHETPAFVQFAQPDGSDDFPIDLMVVNESTFSKLKSGAVGRKFGALTLPVPRPLDLIALKLHALRSPERAALGKDLLDVMALIRLENRNLSDSELCAILEKHASDETRTEIYRQLSGIGG